MIAFFGMGLLGSNFVRALRKRGEQVNVWNRTFAKAQALEAEGAKAFADPAEAARGADRVHLTLSDDAAVDDVLERARAGLPALVIDHTTTSTTGALERIARWRERGITYVHAPVFMGPGNARDATGLMLISGHEIARVRPLLQPMTGKLVELGERPDAAAAFKLMGNCFLMAFTVGLADMLALGKALAISPEQAATLFEHFNPGTTVNARLKRMIDAKYSEASWELTMARKDARLVVDACNVAGMHLTTIPAIAARMDEMIAQGHGNQDWTVIAKDAVSEAS
jgi:3-hydroxyisobutyrate dehydrogenase